MATGKKILFNQREKAFEHYILKDKRKMTTDEMKGLHMIMVILVEAFPTFDIYTAKLNSPKCYLVCGTHESSIDNQNKPAFDFCLKRKKGGSVITLRLRLNSSKLKNEIIDLPKGLQELEVAKSVFTLSELTNDEKSLAKLSQFITMLSKTTIIPINMLGDGLTNKITHKSKVGSANKNRIKDKSIEKLTEKLKQLKQDFKNGKLPTQKVKSRPSQVVLKDLLIAVHEGCVCVVTGCRVECLIDLAHIEDHNYENDELENGLLLRADIHRLYDRSLLTIDKNGFVFINKSLTDEYHTFHGVNIFDRMTKLENTQKKKMQLNLAIKLAASKETDT